VYLLNDLLDLDSDRAHARKCRRPFASGQLSLRVGFVLAPLLLVSSLLLSLLLPLPFQLALMTYYGLTLGYSLHLKRFVLIDALVLACLYSIRIVAGGVAVSVPLSFWLLLFAMFLFLSLAFVKRFAELDALRRRNRVQVAGRG